MYSPWLHFSQNVAPSPDFDSLSQDIHEELPGSVWYSFTSHSLQLLELVCPELVGSMYFPGAQYVQLDNEVAPTADEYLDVGHAMHADCSKIRGDGGTESGVPYFPAMHKIQCVALVAASAYFPIPHTVHSD